MGIFEYKKFEIGFTRVSETDDKVIKVVSDSYIFEILCNIKEKYDFHLSSMQLDPLSYNYIVIKCNKEDYANIFLEFMKSLGSSITNCKIQRRII